jgi:hypothetical protein
VALVASSVQAKGRSVVSCPEPSARTSLSPGPSSTQTRPIANASRAFNLALEGCDVAIQIAIGPTVGTIALTG